MQTCPYIDDILLTSICYVSQIIVRAYFDIMNLGDTSYVIGIKIHRDRLNETLVSSLSGSLHM